MLKLDSKTFQIQDIFHQYVQPDVHKILTSFCTNVSNKKKKGETNLLSYLYI